MQNAEWRPPLRIKESIDPQKTVKVFWLLLKKVTPARRGHSNNASEAAGKSSASFFMLIDQERCNAMRIL